MASFGEFKEQLSDIIDRGQDFIEEHYYGNNLGERLRYPLDEIDYRAEITFQPLKTTPINAELLGENLRGSIDLLGDIFSAGGLVGGSLTGQLRETINQFSGIDFQSDSKAMVEPVGAPITLYMPQAIQFADVAIYNQLALGQLGAVTEAALNAGAGGLSAVGAGIMGIGSQLLGNPGAAANSALARAGVAGMVASVNAQVGGAFRRATQTTLNPNQRTLFEHPNIREFSFTFQLIPTSKKEAEAIQKIVRKFRTEMYPTQIVAGDTGVAVGYEFPNKFEITLKHNGKQIPGTEMLPCYLRGVNVTYNPTQMGMYEDGSFNETTLTLNFVEERALHKGDDGLDGRVKTHEVDINERDIALAGGAELDAATFGGNVPDNTTYVLSHQGTD